MLEILFSPVFTSSFTITDYLLCSLVSIIIGALLALVYSRLGKSDPSYSLTLVLMPAVTQTVIMMVNGNIGTGLAVAGAFSFVRFRSAQYKAEDIMLIFVAVAVGLACSIGYLGFAVLFTLIIIVIMMIFHNIFPSALSAGHKELRITVPEGMDYENELAEIMDRYTSYCDLLSVKTTNMGSLFRLTYDVVLRQSSECRSFINELRVRNANLEISIGVLPEISQ
ncbi:MAG: DUF4956 domain-containing protein [Erysipelotrichaceae bacterium]|nr:DUF4956 domain-containing protein [Erysipelotrichaceae bacterium]